MSYAIDTRAPGRGTKPSVYPGAVALGAADLDVEEQFNVWLDRFLWLSEPLQRGEYDALAAKKASGAPLSDLEERQLTFAASQLGIEKIPEAIRPGEEVQAQTIEEVSIVSTVRSRLPAFLVGMAGLAVGAALIVKKRGR